MASSRGRRESGAGMPSMQTDPRISWVIARITTAFRPCVGKRDLDWLEDDEQVMVLREFLEHRETTTLFIYVLHANGLAVSLDPSTDACTNARKVMYFLKKKPVQVTQENLTSLVSVGEVLPNALDSLWYTQAHINPGLVRLEENIPDIAELNRSSLREHISSFRGALEISKGMVEGKTFLPLPMHIDVKGVERAVRAAGPSRDADGVYQLEAAVQGWSKQIRLAISRDAEELWAPDHPTTHGRPGVLEYVRFWERRKEDLEGLAAQLATPLPMKIVAMLTRTGSTYVRPFKEIQVELKDAVAEARDAVRFLQPLSEDVLLHLAGPHPAAMSRLATSNIFQSIFHFVVLIWCESKALNTAPRIVLFIKHLCNDFVQAAYEHLEGEDFFTGNDAKERVKVVLDAGERFKEAYFEAKAANTQRDIRRPWKFSNASLFGRLDAFLERCHDLLDAMATAQLFSLLNPDEGRVIVGGASTDANGVLSTVYEDFQVALEQIARRDDFNVLDIDDPRFDTLFTAFRNRCKQLERRIGQLLISCVAASSNLADAFKLIDTFDAFLPRPCIQQDWLQQQVVVLDLFHRDLLEVQERLTEQLSRERRLEDPRNFAKALLATAGADGNMFPQARPETNYERALHVYDRMPPTIAKIAWARSLQNRVEAPYQRLQELLVAAAHGERWGNMETLHASLLKQIASYIDVQTASWLMGISSAHKKLNLALLTRAGNLMRVNFSSDLVRLIREVAYMQDLSLNDAGDGRRYAIPAHARELLGSSHGLRTRRLKLDAICEGYNALNEKLLPVERPLIDDQLDSLTGCLNEGVDKVTWAGADTDAFIDGAVAQTDRLSRVLRALKQNGAELELLLQKYKSGDTFLPFESKDAKPLLLSAFMEKYGEYKKQRLSLANDVNRDIAMLLESGFNAVAQLKKDVKAAELTVHHPSWVDYLAHLSERTRAGIVAAVLHALENLEKQLNPARIADISGVPLLEVKLQLNKDPDTGAQSDGFDPPLSKTVYTDAPKQASRLQQVTADLMSGKPVRRSSRASASSRPRSRRSSYSSQATASPREMQATPPPTPLDEHIKLWVADMQDFATYFKQLDDAGVPYAAAARGDAAVAAAVDAVTAHVVKAVTECQQLQLQFLRFAQLWEQDAAAEFEAFLTSAQERRETRAGQSERGGYAKSDVDSAGDLEASIHVPSTPTGTVRSGGGRMSHAGVVDDADDDEDGGEALVQYERHICGGAPLDAFGRRIVGFNQLLTAVANLPDGQTCGWIKVDAKPLKHSLRDLVLRQRATYSSHLMDRIRADLTDLQTFMRTADTELDRRVGDGDIDGLRDVMKWVRACKDRNDRVRVMGEPIRNVVNMLLKSDSIAADAALEVEGVVKEIPDRWTVIFKKSLRIREEFSKMQDIEAERLESAVVRFQNELQDFAKWFDAQRPFAYLEDTAEAYEEIDNIHLQLKQREVEAARINQEQDLFDQGKSDFRVLSDCRAKLGVLKYIWDLIAHTRAMFRHWYAMPFVNSDIDALTDEVMALQKQLKVSSRGKAWRCFEELRAEVKGLAQSLPLLRDLKDGTMRDRHWAQLFREIGRSSLTLNPTSLSCSLEALLSLNLGSQAEAIQGVVERATKEAQIEVHLRKISATWEAQTLSYAYDAELKAWTLGKIDNILELLESDSNLLQTMSANRYMDFFQESVNLWLGHLGKVETTLQTWVDVQKRWANLYPIFITSPDIKASLSEDAAMFESADELFREMMDKIKEHDLVINVCCTDLLKRALERDDSVDTILAMVLDVFRQCEKSLAEYLESKKRVFPRFFFLADSDLVDVLSKGSTPPRVMLHMAKIIDAVETFEFSEDPDKAQSTVVAMRSVQGERVTLLEEYVCTGPVEDWLQGCVHAMQKALHMHVDDAHTTYMEIPRMTWVFNHTCQAIIVASRLQFTWETNSAFAQLEDGNEMALKDHLKLCQRHLGDEIGLVLQDLTAHDRTMLVHLITIDVHSRDVVKWLIDERAENDQHFTWQSQLRYYWDDNRGTMIRICDSSFVHGREYTGLCGCLVVTRLTDRCYITLTQALKLVQGGAPAGPAGTGKTETTKDLARNLGMACYVFNCSDQMDHRGLGQIFKGLAMSGCWGCFDEFNRISIEVLSVVATQLSSVLYAIRTQKQRFRFAGEEECPLNPTVGVFITMNPGYAGRTELPENIKSLFRPCAMVIPDIQGICEILLAAAGFRDAKDLALKFVQLYRLAKELLSQQAHYDWGLRAVKSVLVIAGALRRADPDLDERSVLLRALRDTNMAKLSKDDVYVFKGLIRALFPGLDNVQQKVDEDLRGRCLTACEKLGLLPGDGKVFVQKCLQFDELLAVRHSVFVLGPAGCGKSQCIAALKTAYTLSDPNACKARYLNPKAMSADELYGCANELTKEWKDGHLAFIFKEFSTMSKQNPCAKWIVLDGVIDTEWIESMNTVMDDNKVLTLANNDRIPLTDSMRMVFEISQLKNASPATVSRAGVLYINDSDVGWAPYKDRWLNAREDERVRNTLDSFFDFYLPPVFEYCKRSFRPVVPIVDISIVETLCVLLDALLGNLVPQTTPPDVYERYFCFATIWAFGGALNSDGRIDYRAAFSSWWIKDMQSKVKICDDKFQVFDFNISHETNHEWQPWAEALTRYQPSDGYAFNTRPFVDTVSSVRIDYLVTTLLQHRKGTLLVGEAGTGKSYLMQRKMATLDRGQWIERTLTFSAYTPIKAVQTLLEANVERGGRVWHPPSRKTLLVFLDDLNLPVPDRYGTQLPLAPLRQFLDYGCFYDTANPGVEKHITGVQVLASMNHKAGSFNIMDRLQRRFTVLSVDMPAVEDLKLIYLSILGGHVKGWGREVRSIAGTIVDASIDLLMAMRNKFPPTESKFYYQWNLREMALVFEGLGRTVKEIHDGHPLLYARLWRHESDRTFRDRLADESDTREYDSLMTTVTTKYFGGVLPVDDVLKEPNLWGPFGQHNDDIDIYDTIDTYDQLSMFLEGKLEEYNEDTTKAVMDLVLFQQAMEHVVRICRVVCAPKGHALLIGVGGSGKRSLSRLAAYITELEATSILFTASYSAEDFRRTVSELCFKSGRKGQRFAFIVTDAHIVCHDQLEVLSELLNCGNIAGLFEAEAVDELCHAMVTELRQRQHPDYNNRETCWNYFLSKVQTNLHCILCFSPVGAQLATWCRHFPALAAATVIDWYHPWPEEALSSVSKEFLSAEDSAIAEDEDLVKGASECIAEAHLFVTKLAEDYRLNERRHCYTTPKSFMELIATYKTMLEEHADQIKDRKARLEDGIYKIKHAQQQVDELQVTLQAEDVDVKNATAEVNALMEQIAVEKAACQAEAERVEVEKMKTEKLVIETDGLRADAEQDLEVARPIVERAKEALQCLNKQSLIELRSFTKPPVEVMMVTAAVMCLTSPPHRIPRADRAKDWNNAKKMMANVPVWMKELEDFAAHAADIPQPCIDSIQQWVRDPAFDSEAMRSKSEAASYLAAWVTNMDAYHTLRCQIRPKEIRLEEAQLRLEQSKQQFKKVQEHVMQLNIRLNGLVDAHNQATERSRILKQQAETTRLKMNIAERLVGGLADEHVRWGKTVDGLEEKMHLLTGDVLASAAFISYAGPFSGPYRRAILEHLAKVLKDKGLPHTEDLDLVMQVLTSEAEVAAWNNEGLPSDRISTENGAIVKNAKRWPLLVDPQLQAIGWIKAREEKNHLVVTHRNDPKYLESLLFCMEQGHPCIIENLSEQLDPVIDHVLSKDFTRKGNYVSCKVGDRDVPVDVGNFRLYLQTKHPNPQYRPEVHAQTTIVNFVITEPGLEDQLLAVVVNKERPELEQRRVSLIRKMNQYKIDLSECEDKLLYELSNASGELLKNVVLISNLEQTKKQSAMIITALAEDRATQAELIAKQQVYKPAATRGCLLYFEMVRLSQIDAMYQYSLESFMKMFVKSILKVPHTAKALGGELSQHAENERIENLMNSVTETLFAFVSRGLFEKHKVIFSSMLCFSILKQQGVIEPRHLDFLLTGGRKQMIYPPKAISDWCTPSVWTAINALAGVPGPVSNHKGVALPAFEQLPDDIKAHNRWRSWAENPTPEMEKLPADWRNLDNFQRLLIIRCVRPDRLIEALRNFVAQKLGKFYVQDNAVPLATSLEDGGPTTPMFFILSPGVDPVRKVEALAMQRGYSYEQGTFVNISLGQGQEGRAVEALDRCFEHGGWAMLSNIHLTHAWLQTLEKILDNYQRDYQRMEWYEKKMAAKREQAAQEQKRREEVEVLKREIELANKRPSDPEALAESLKLRSPPVQALASPGEPAALPQLQGTTLTPTPGGPGVTPIPKQDESTAVGGGDGGVDVRKVLAEQMTSLEDITAVQESGEETEDEEEEEEAEDVDDDEFRRGHEDFRIFLSAEPSEDPNRAVPIGILQRCVKLTNEPPSGVRAIMQRSMAEFKSEPWEHCIKPDDFKSVLFAMCWFHSIAVERSKFGALGWNRTYPFNMSDLTSCIDILTNYMAERPTVPWDDLRFTFGEIIYGGHITDDWDRRLCHAYLQQFICAETTENLELTKGYQIPHYHSYADAAQCIEEMPNESPAFFGLHAHSEFGYHVAQAEYLFRVVQELHPSSSHLENSNGEGGLDVVSASIRTTLDDILTNCVAVVPIGLGSICERLEDDRTPQQHVFYQECERMNALQQVIKTTLQELMKGIDGVLSMSDRMLELYDCIRLDKVPDAWLPVSYPSTRPLGSWCQNIVARMQQLQDWERDLITPKVTRVDLLFNPMSFITAVCQHTSIVQGQQGGVGYALDELDVVCEVGKRMIDGIEYSARDGNRIFGFKLEGAHWDVGNNTIDESRLKEQYCVMPVITVKALPISKIDRRDQYQCPVYRTPQRGASFVTSIYLKTKQAASKWVIAGVAAVLDVPDY